MDPAYASNAGRLAHRDELIAMLAAEFVTRPTTHWVDELMACGVPCAPVNTVAEALASPPVHERHLIESATNPSYGAYRHVAGTIPALGGAGAAGAPPLGQDTESVLRELGYSDGALGELIADGTLVASPPARD
jgi:formyl-CoA transferase